MKIRSLLLLGALIAAPVAAQDVDEAERQFRVARRLAAEGSPQALDAMRKVVALAPQGPLADDALVEQALLAGLARWPEQLGDLSAAGLAAASAPLDQVVRNFPGADRHAEASYRAAMLDLEPLNGRDVTGARLELLRVATRGASSEWGRAARYTLAWLAFQQGDLEQARQGMHRLLVDAPDSVAAQRAAVMLARDALARGEAGRAASLLQQAIARRADPRTGSLALRELAMRHLLESGRTAPASALERVVGGLSLRGADAIAAGIDGGVAIADARGDAIVTLAADGAVTRRYALPDVEHVVVDEQGRYWAADGESVMRLDPERGVVTVASQGEFAPARAIAVGRGGTIWLVDRRGERIGVIRPGETVPQQIWNERGARLVSLGLAADRLVGLDSKSRGLVALAVDGKPLAMQTPDLGRATSLAVDPAGRIVAIDPREALATILDHAGKRLAVINLAEGGATEPVVATWGFDGVLHVYDEESGSWFRLR